MMMSDGRREDGSNSTSSSSAPNNNHRLQSIADYSSLHPHALACSLPISDASYAALYNNDTTTTSNTNIQSRSTSPAFVSRSKSELRQRHRDRRHPSSTSLGAIAGSDGIAIFRMTQPHVPLMILSHASSNAASTIAASATSTSLRRPSSAAASSSSSSVTTSLSFSCGPSRRSMYLASARGAGILVWDVSGHSLSPLQGRLGVEHCPDLSPITSLCWCTTSRGKSTTQLAATTANSACLWDLRTSNSSYRPSLRFGVTSNTNATRKNKRTVASANRQIACSDRAEEYAVMDASGTVRIFDTRMTDRTTRLSTGSLYQFNAFQSTGVGISYLSLTSRKEQCWVTWGLDEPNTNAVVKVWLQHHQRQQETSTSSTTDTKTGPPPDDYWYMDSSPEGAKFRKTESLSNHPEGYRMVGTCTSTNLACARVCPAPVEDSLITVGLDMDETSSSVAGWHAELWKLNFDKSNNVEGIFHETNLDRIVAFQSATELPRIHAGLDVRPGSLHASELAISQYSSGTQRANYGLVLCCLGDDGFVTTHAIPEALPVDHQSRKEQEKDTVESIPLRIQPTKLFHADSDFTIDEAAQVWGNAGDLNFASTRRDASLGSLPISAVPASGVTSPLFPQGMGMQFDMDVPLTSAGIPGLPGIGGVGELISPASLSAVGSIDENEQSDPDVRRAVMENIDTALVPCPRMCGAVFSPGIGGLVAFHNGEVKKMWNWWVQNDKSRTPGFVVEPSLASTKKSANSTGATTRGTSAAPYHSNLDYARTLKDVWSMTAAAKAAQWGEKAESETSSTGFPDLGNNFFDDNSDGSSDSGEYHDDDVDATTSSKQQKQMYDNYFGDFQRPLIHEFDRSHDNLDSGKNDTVLDGTSTTFRALPAPSAGVLSPVVKISHEYDRIALQNQTRALAEGWHLGNFRVQNKPDRSGLKTRKVVFELPNRTYSDPGRPLTQAVPEVHSKRVLPSYRSLLPVAQASRSMFPEGSKSNVNERNGGDHSVRPNMQESMAFLRNLFTQQHHDGGRSTFPSMLSPPDDPMLPKTNSRREFSGSYSGKEGEQRRNESERYTLGVYTVHVDTPKAENDLEAIEDICLHNASVCEELRELTKMEAWRLVAKVVHGRMKCTDRGFGGLGGISGGALGVVLVENLLRYFESLGDAQMLASLICVLRNPNVSTEMRGGLLPIDQDARYDRYIRRYAELLFSWGLFTVRAEVTKHLSRPFSLCETDTTDSEFRRDQNASVSLAFACLRCGVSSDSGYCQSCNEYSFRCAVCDIAVRGLFTSCERCGHGGHFNHMLEWFAMQNEECPTGCGCNCRLTSMVRKEPTAHGLTNTT